MIILKKLRDNWMESFVITGKSFVIIGKKLRDNWEELRDTSGNLRDHSKSFVIMRLTFVIICQI